ncbi:MAG TPA: hypothetical protein VGO69_01285, partial [Pyrinomonadaceae bacterium]|nr:hypothetical protein [Pyrinomonadaceae bacterium]
MQETIEAESPDEATEETSLPLDEDVQSLDIEDEDDDDGPVIFDADAEDEREAAALRVNERG